MAPKSQGASKMDEGKRDRDRLKLAIDKLASNRPVGEFETTPG